MRGSIDTPPSVLPPSSYFGTSCISMKGDLPGLSNFCPGTIGSYQYRTFFPGLLPEAPSVICMPRLMPNEYRPYPAPPATVSTTIETITDSILFLSASHHMRGPPRVTHPAPQ